MIRWTDEALGDIEQAVDWLAARSPAAAGRMIGLVFEAVERLSEVDLDGPEDQLLDGRWVRSWPVPPMRVYYERRGGDLWVLQVTDQRRHIAPVRS